MSFSRKFTFARRALPALLSTLLAAGVANAFTPFVVKDIQVNGVQRVDPGTIFTYLPVRVGDTFTEEQAAEAIQRLYSSGLFSDVTIDTEGLITASFADGTTKALGRVAIGNFSNPSGLRQQGDGRWTVTGESGEPQVGVAGGDGFGSIQTGALERANVDLTEELVALIAAQRNFQANAKAIETANAMTQTVTNLRN